MRSYSVQRLLSGEKVLLPNGQRTHPGVTWNIQHAETEARFRFNSRLRRKRWPRRSSRRHFRLSTSFETEILMKRRPLLRREFVSQWFGSQFPPITALTTNGMNGAAFLTSGAQSSKLFL